MRLYLLAGEPSGDRLGAALMSGLKHLVPDVEFRGIAGPMMQAEGMKSLFPMDELSVMGLAEVLPRYAALRRRLVETARDVVQWQPDALITIDSPDFSLRLAERVKRKCDLHTCHYVAPTVWAWRPGRARRMARHIDQVLALLPFEPPYMEAAGMRCDFVGHPVVAEPLATSGETEAFRATANLENASVVLVLPGSRRSEVERMAPIYAGALKLLTADIPDLRVVVPAAMSVVDQVLAAVRDWPGDPVVVDPRQDGAVPKRAAFAAADVALATSGTVSLELAAAGTPMVIAYDMNRLTWLILSRMVKLDAITLVNLVSETRVVPELLGPRCQPGPIAAALKKLIEDRTARQAQFAAMSETMTRLGQGGEPPGLRAARAVIEGLEARRT